MYYFSFSSRIICCRVWLLIRPREKITLVLPCKVPRAFLLAHVRRIRCLGQIIYTLIIHEFPHLSLKFLGAENTTTSRVSPSQSTLTTGKNLIHQPWFFLNFIMLNCNTPSIGQNTNNMKPHQIFQKGLNQDLFKLCGERWQVSWLVWLTPNPLCFNLLPFTQSH